jgi:hypothetical protein
MQGSMNSWASRQVLCGTAMVRTLVTHTAQVPTSMVYLGTAAGTALRPGVLGSTPYHCGVRYMYAFVPGRTTWEVPSSDLVPQRLGSSSLAFITS